MTKFTLRATLILWPIASFVLSVAQIFIDRGQQWDLRNYLNGLTAYRDGLNPYVDSSFIYPPVFLPILNWLTVNRTYDQLYVGLLFGKVAFILVLLGIWKRWFAKDTPAHVFLPLAWIGFFSTIAIDLYAGNVSVVETTLLFAGFLSFTKGHLYAFAALIAIASTPKIAPIVFLVALLTKPNGWRPFLAGFGGFTFFLGFNYGLYPTFSRSFLTEAWSRTSESQVINPSSLAFIKDALPKFADVGAPVVWLAFAIFVYVVSWRAWRRQNTAPTGLESILFLILVYVLTVPRMKDYAYMIALPSALFAIQSYRVRRPEWLLAIPLAVNTARSAPLLFETPFGLLWYYYPLAVALGFWWIFVDEFRRRA